MSETPKLQKPSAETIEALAKVVGHKNAIRDEADMAAYLTEWRDRYRGKAALVLKPGSHRQEGAGDFEGIRATLGARGRGQFTDGIQ